MKAHRTALVWFRRDLRLTDNPSTSSRPRARGPRRAVVRVRTIPRGGIGPTSRRRLAFRRIYILVTSARGRLSPCSDATGIPLVDTGMRELWRTGWMHNRIRMIAASVLTKNLQIHWLQGARWFWETLVDANLANNTLGWQWVAGCGADAAPYYRKTNPLPVVDLRDSRKRALQVYAQLRNQ